MEAKIIMKKPAFKTEHVANFLENAPNEEYINEKCSLIVGLHGCYRAQDYVGTYYNKNDKIKIEIYKTSYVLCICVSKTPRDLP